MAETIRLGARLRAARKSAGFKTSREFIKKHKVPASTYSQHESGARIPDEETLKFYSKIFSVNLNWLSEGTGHPFKTESVAKKNILNEELIDLKNWDNKKISKSADLNTELLTNILKQIIKINRIDLPEKTLKNITSETAKAYKSITSSAASPKLQTKLLKEFFAAYK